MVGVTMKLLIIGLDGADHNLFVRFRSELPNLNTIANEGVSGRLESLDMPLTPPAWFSMYTGCRPEEHGIESWRYSWDWDWLKACNVPCFWEYLYPYKVGLINLPCVHGHEVNGFVVPGFIAPFKKWPPDL